MTNVEAPTQLTKEGPHDPVEKVSIIKRQARVLCSKSLRQLAHHETVWARFTERFNEFRPTSQMRVSKPIVEIIVLNECCGG